MTKKLYKVTCRGMQHRIAGSTALGISFVVAEDAEAAYKKVRDRLNECDWGFRHEREMEKVELVAEQCDSPGCGTMLYL